MQIIAKPDYPTYLLRLAERELIDRERRATERRIKEAAFPVLKTIETLFRSSRNVLFLELS
jgi:DNA replication protein DnaC